VSLNDANTDDTDIFEGTVPVVAWLIGYLVDDVHTLSNFSKNGIIAIEVGRTAYSFVNIALLPGVGMMPMCDDLIEFVVGKSLTGNYIKLAGGAGLGGIAIAGDAQSASFMKIAVIDLGRDGIFQAAITEHLAGLCVFGIGISALDHKLRYDTVKEEAVVGMIFGQLHHIIAIERCIVIQDQFDGTIVGNHFYFYRFLFC